MTYILDTNIFNKLVDGKFSINNLPSNCSFVATHIQIDEINNTKNAERRAQLFLMFAQIRPEILPTESFVFDKSRWDQGKWGDGLTFEKLKTDLDSLNKSKSNNIQDALIAEVALINGITLLTGDGDLADVSEKYGINVIRFMD